MPNILYSNLILKALSTNLSSTESLLIHDYKGRSISGTQILKGIDTLALDLKSAGINRGDRVIFLARPSIESMLYFFALQRAGAVVVLVDLEMGQENFASRIRFSEAGFILQDRALGMIEKYAFLKPILRLLNIWFPDNLPFPKDKRITLRELSSVIEQKDMPEYVEETINEDTDMAVIFTSGTVSQPKGVVHSYKSLSNALNIISSEISISKDDFLYASQFYFLLIGLMVSARTYIPKQRAFDPKTFLDISSRLGITAAFLLPYEGEMVHKQCKKNGRLLPDSFKTILFGSAPVTKGFLARFSEICEPQMKVFGVYGSTEMLPISMIDMSEKLAYKGTGDLLGKPVRDTKIIISEDKEILASGPQLFSRYLGDASNLKHFASGDLGEIDSDGNLVLLGRKKDMIIRKGFNVYPALFESSISKIPGIVECSLIGIYDDTLEDEKIVLFIVSDLKEHGFTDKLKGMLRSGVYSIDSYAYPDEIILIDDLPRSGRSKKIDKASLREIAKKKYA